MAIPVNSGDIYTDVSSLRSLKRDAATGSQAALEKTAEQFEALFLQMMLKSMRQAAPSDGMFDSDQTRFYQEMFDQQIALDMAKKRQLGIADLLVKQLGKEQGGVSEAGKGLRLDIERLRLAQPVNRAAAAAVVATAPTPAPASAPVAAAGEKITGFTSPADFIEKLYPLAEKYGAELGVDPKVLLAQAALETGWGKSVSRDASGVSSHNLFNIKADKRWSGPQTVVTTLEYEQGRPLRQQAAFRAYPDFEASFSDYVAFLKSSPRYQQALTQAGDGPAFVHALHQAGYATDPKYATKINTIMSSGILGDSSA
jgi:flagellar protein FlgJ